MLLLHNTFFTIMIVFFNCALKRNIQLMFKKYHKTFVCASLIMIYFYLNPFSQKMHV